MADRLIKKIFSFGRKSSSAPAESRNVQKAPLHINKKTAAAEPQNPPEPHKEKRQTHSAPAAEYQETAITAKAHSRAARKARGVNQSGLHIRAKTGSAETDIAETETDRFTPQSSWLERLTRGLTQSSRRLNDSLSSAFNKRKLDEAALEELEDTLLQADLGMETTAKITDTLRAGRFGKDINAEDIRKLMADEITQILEPCAQNLELDLSHKPHVILMVGVNGSGKTTTIGKLAAKMRSGGLSVMLAAGDTFRAAAIEQLHIWGKRTGCPVISSHLGADPAALAYDAYKQAQETGSDVLLIDTAGRLHNKTELMDELAKIVRILRKRDPAAPHTVLQSLDATTGQNALTQVEMFKKIANVNGLVMTKLDGTARGGILASIAARYKLPIYFIGIGENIADLEPFSAHDFAAAIAGISAAS